MATRKYPLAEVPWAKARAKAMEDVFGPAKGVQHHLHSLAAMERTPSIHVWFWPDRAGPGKSLLMTEGLSDVKLYKPNDDPAPWRLELLTVAGEDPTWQANALRRVAQSFVRLYDCLFMSMGHTLSLTRPPAPLMVGSKLTRFVFLQPPSMFLAAGERLLGQTIEGKPLLALWCTGIAEEELPMLARLGHEEFGKRLERHSLEFDPLRPLLEG